MPTEQAALTQEAPQESTSELAEVLPPVLTVDEVAALLRVARKTVYAQIDRGEIPGTRRVGRAIRVSRDVVLEWLRQRVTHGDIPGGRGIQIRRAVVLAERTSSQAEVFFTVEEVAALLRINPKTAYEKVGRGDIPGAFRVGRAVRLRRETVLEWLRNGAVLRSTRHKK